VCRVTANPFLRFAFFIFHFAAASGTLRVTTSPVVVNLFGEDF